MAVGHYEYVAPWRDVIDELLGGQQGEGSAIPLPCLVVHLHPGVPVLHGAVSALPQQRHRTGGGGDDAVHGVAETLQYL